MAAVVLVRHFFMTDLLKPKGDNFPRPQQPALLKAAHGRVFVSHKTMLVGEAQGED